MHLEEKKKIMTLIAEAYLRSDISKSLHRNGLLQQEAALILADYFGPIEIKVAPPYEQLSHTEFGIPRLPMLIGQSAITVEQNPWNNNILRVVVYLSPYINEFKADHPGEETFIPFLDFLGSIGTFLDYFPANVRLDEYLFAPLEMNLFCRCNGIEQLILSTKEQLTQLELTDYNDGNSFPSIRTTIPPVWIALRAVGLLGDILEYEQREVFSICKKVFKDSNFPYETTSSLTESELELYDLYEEYNQKYRMTQIRNLPNQLTSKIYTSKKMDGTAIFGVCRGVVKITFSKDILGAVEKLPLDEDEKIDSMTVRAASIRNPGSFSYTQLKKWVLTSPDGDTLLMTKSIHID